MCALPSCNAYALKGGEGSCGKGFKRSQHRLRVKVLQAKGLEEDGQGAAGTATWHRDVP